MRQRILIVTCLLVQFCIAHAESAKATFLPHELLLDSHGRTLAWYQPGTPGAAYAHVCGLAVGFLKSVPVEPTSGLKLYFVHPEFNGPSQAPDYAQGTSGLDWTHNPACAFAGFVQSLAVDWRTFSGDSACLPLVRECLDHILEHGTTPAGWPWPGCPYASSDPRSRVYQGGTRWELERRGDGLHCIEPDKVGELGVGYLKFWEITGEERFLAAALGCADALAVKVRAVSADTARFAVDYDCRSPWPFRVNARTGVVVDEYCSNVIEPVRLFDELLRLERRIGLSEERSRAYTRARTLAWDWLFAKNGPIKTCIWNGYFEDIPSDPQRENRVQVTPLETARYILQHPESDRFWRRDVEYLLGWVASAFGDSLEGIKEQTWCYSPMGSHTARYASVCALYYEKTGETRYRDEAYHFFNFATYCCEDNGYVWVGPGWSSSWFSDGYGDYIRHFMAGLAAVPQWAPSGEDHILRSSSVVQSVSYGPQAVTYRTFDPQASEILRLRRKPRAVTLEGAGLDERSNLDAQGWTWSGLPGGGGLLRLRHDSGNVVRISL